MNCVVCWSKHFQLAFLLATFLNCYEKVAASRANSNGVPGSDSDVERELTFEIGPGKEECFFEFVHLGNVIDIEYQVYKNFFLK